MKILSLITIAGLIFCISGCGESTQKSTDMEKVVLMTLDPGHFHAALVQKSMYEQVDPTVYVYGPEGADVDIHLGRIEGFNTRAENPTSWVEKVYTGTDYLEKMIAEKPGNVMMVSGNNARKTEYIKAAIDAGINVFADKPMVINEADFLMLEEAFKTAGEKGVLLYDIMTERFERTTVIQRELSKISALFGELSTGSAEAPAITKESVHHFFKYVSGKALIRPAWFFDTGQQGEGMVDVTTHLVDLVQWEAFPEQVIERENIELVSTRRWTTDLTPDMFEKVTGLKEFPDYLEKDVSSDLLKVYSNGEIVYKINGKYAKVSVIWNYQAPEGTGDTHYSIMRGTKSDLVIRQGEEEAYKPTLYIELHGDADPESYEAGMQEIFEADIAKRYPGVRLIKQSDKVWKVDIPEKYKIGHEAHFEQVTRKYLEYLEKGNMPDWEIPNMITKYYVTTQALKMAE